MAPKSVFRGILHLMNLEKKFAIIDYGQSFSLIASPQNYIRKIGLIQGVNRSHAELNKNYQKGSMH